MCTKKSVGIGSFVVAAVVVVSALSGCGIPEAEMPWNTDECNSGRPDVRKEVLREQETVTVRCLNSDFRLEGMASVYSEDGELISRKYFVDGKEQSVTR